MNTYRIFLASSFRLTDERQAIEIAIARLNDEFAKRNVHLQLDIWEKFDSANDPQRKQDFYNNHILTADLFIIVYQAELGAFTREEYELAQQLFVREGLPRIYLFKKNGKVDFDLSDANLNNLKALEAIWYERDRAQWPWEFENKEGLIHKIGENIHSVFNDPDLPHFHFPEVKKLSINNPEMPVGFLGREDELITIYQKLNRGGKLMLINAEGGIGKTTLAAKFWNQALNNYKHAAWLFCEGGIVNSLKELAPNLNIDLSGLNEVQQLKALKKGLHDVQNQFLLVLDNANDKEDIRLFKQEFEGFHWHVLITSRCQGVLGNEQELPITHLPPPLAKELFLRFYSEDTPEFDSLLDSILRAINYHTLLTEVFARNLKKARKLSLNEFLERLENEGLYLREDNFKIDTSYNIAQKRKAATTDEILEVLYDFSQLQKEQRYMLVNLALLPAETYPLDFLDTLFTDGSKKEINRLTALLSELFQTGWISGVEDEAYRLSPVIQKLVLEKHAETLGDDSSKLLERLNYITDTDRHNLIRISLTDAAPYIQPVHHITRCLRLYPTYEIARYNFNAGVYYTNIGDLMNALKTHITYVEIYKSLFRLEPKNLNYKNGLAVSHQYLGNIYDTVGDHENALIHYLEDNRLSQETHLASPENLMYKNSLAISHQYLGNIYYDTGDQKNALIHYLEFNKLSKAIHLASPENLRYKNGLAASYQYLGIIYNVAGDQKNALIHYLEYNRLSQEIHLASPENLEYKKGLAISYSKLGNNHNATGDQKKALIHYLEYNRLSQEIHLASPENLEYKKGLAVSYSKLGNSYHATDDQKKALIHYLEYNRLSQEIHQASPENLRYKNGLAASYAMLGTFYRSQNDIENTIQNFQISRNLFFDLWQRTEGKVVEFTFIFAQTTFDLTQIVKILHQQNHPKGHQESIKSEIKVMRKQGYEALLPLATAGLLQENQKWLVKELGDKSWYEF